MSQIQEEFSQVFSSQIHRTGSEELLNWLGQKDFFTAPASTKYHCACEGGLAMHSLNVYRVLRERYFEEGDSEESFAICGLLHDICKAQFYKVSTRNVKNEETGQWEKKPFYMIEDSFAIRWHMGGFDEAARGGSFAISHAYEKYPLAVKLHLADLEATYLREQGTSEAR